MARRSESGEYGVDQVTWRIVRPNPLYPRAVRHAVPAEESSSEFLKRWTVAGGGREIALTSTHARLLAGGEMEIALGLLEEQRIEAARINEGLPLNNTFGGVHEVVFTSDEVDLDAEQKTDFGMTHEQFE